MIQPSREAFRALARDHTVVPVWREVLADLITPVAAFARVVGEEDGFLLESVEHGERWGRFSFVGRRPLATLIARGRTVEVEGPLPASVPQGEGAYSIPPYDLDALLVEAELVVDWYAPNVAKIAIPASGRNAFTSICTRLFGEVVGREPLEAARTRHIEARAGLPLSATQLSRGEPVLGTEFV